MTVCKLEIKSTLAIHERFTDDCCSLNEYLDEKWVSVESLEHHLKVDKNRLENYNNDFCKGQIHYVKELLGLLEQKEPFCEKASPKHDGENKP